MRKWEISLIPDQMDMKNISYCIGQIDAYFEDNVSQDFWITNAVYVAHASMFAIKWAEKFGQKEINGMIRRA